MNKKESVVTTIRIKPFVIFITYMSMCYTSSINNDDDKRSNESLDDYLSLKILLRGAINNQAYLDNLSTKVSSCYDGYIAKQTNPMLKNVVISSKLDIVIELLRFWECIDSGLLFSAFYTHFDVRCASEFSYIKEIEKPLFNNIVYHVLYFLYHVFDIKKTKESNELDCILHESISKVFLSTNLLDELVNYCCDNESVIDALLQEMNENQSLKEENIVIFRAFVNHILCFVLFELQCVQ